MITILAALLLVYCFRRRRIGTEDSLPKSLSILFFLSSLIALAVAGLFKWSYLLITTILEHISPTVLWCWL